MSASETYTFHADPGHGWLEVPLHTCEGLSISLYSYTDGVSAYLEEDCDAPLWMLHHNVTERQVCSVQHNNDCFVRGLAAYGL